MNSQYLQLATAIRFSAIGHWLSFCPCPTDECFWAAFQVSNLAAYFLPGRIKQYVGGEAFDTILFCQFLILGLFCRRLTGPSRKIKLDQDKLFGSKGRKRWLREDLFIHLDAIRAPIRAGKVQENVFILLGSCALGGGIVRLPNERFAKNRSNLGKR